MIANTLAAVVEKIMSLVITATLVFDRPRIANPMSDQSEDLNHLQQWWKQAAQSDETLRGLQKEIDKALRGSGRERAKTSTLYLLDDKSAETLDPSLRRLRWNFAIADVIAGDYKKSASHGAEWIASFVALTAIGVWTFQNGDAIAKDAPAILGELNFVQLAGLLSIIIFTALSFEARRRFQRLRSNLLTARSLAEALRVDFFQRLNGTGFDTLETLKSHHPDSKHHSMLLIALQVVQKCCGLSGLRSASPDPESIEWTKKYWLQEQSKYFGNTMTKEASFASLAETRLSLCFILTGIAIVASLGLLVAPDVLSFPLIRSWLEIDKADAKVALTLPRSLFDLLTPILGIFSAFFHQRAAEHAISAQKYRQAHLAIENAISEIEPAHPDLTLKLFKRIAYQAIAETADWGAYQREQSKHMAFR